jgi:ketol-acid reductoisomerase
MRATDNGFTVVRTRIDPRADLVLNLTRQAAHGRRDRIMPSLMRRRHPRFLHGFNIVEEGMQIRDDLTVIMVVLPHGGARGVQEGFRVPTLIAVHLPTTPEVRA